MIHIDLVEKKMMQVMMCSKVVISHSSTTIGSPTVHRESFLGSLITICYTLRLVPVSGSAT
jgi:hypothetical protein